MWFVPSWFTFGWPYAPRNLSISSRFSNFFEYSFSNYSLMILWISLYLLVVSPFSSLILLIWIIHILLLFRFTEGLSILLIFLKKHHFVSLILCIVLFISISLILALTFMISVLFFWGVHLVLVILGI
jgi:hypothetical protein